MPQSQALIVDDSKTAQYQLKKMLDKYGLEINTVLSAEEALDYLKHHHPNVIFLDHHMEGMDGLSALKVIKDNPETAVIPVIMYTSEKDQLYVGQARALGALDILTKGEIRPSTLDRVLKSLKIGSPDTDAVATAANDHPVVEQPAPASTSGVVEDCASGDAKPEPVNADVTVVLAKFQSQLDRQLQEHAAEIRSQIADNEARITKFIDHSFEEKAQYQQQLTVEMGHKFLRARQQLKRLALIGPGALLISLLIAGGFFTWHFKQLQSDINSAKISLLAVIQAVRSNPQTDQPLLQQMQARQEASNALPLDIINWALNNDLRFSYAETPLNEQQTGKISELLETLQLMDYRGTVELDVRFGNVCLKPDGNNMLILADKQFPFGDCIMLADTAPTFEVNDLISIPYLDLQERAANLKDGEISLQLTTSGLETPYVEYLETASTAGEWNNIALQNNRIVVGLSE